MTSVTLPPIRSTNIVKYYSKLFFSSSKLHFKYKIYKIKKDLGEAEGEEEEEEVIEQEVEVEE